MEEQKIALKLQGDMCLDDSDKNFIMIWSRAIDIADQPLIVCWQATHPEAAELKDMVSKWDKFVVLTAAGKPLGTADDYFLVK
ncbi:hypothetical protein [Frisingicoccus sp.]|uniref:hypothetical protein n=1 Tax=Frisingicoccus sp. TaxID=1918627 RepID=UPI0015C1943F